MDLTELISQSPPPPQAKTQPAKSQSGAPSEGEGFADAVLAENQSDPAKAPTGRTGTEAEPATVESESAAVEASDPKIGDAAKLEQPGLGTRASDPDRIRIDSEIATKQDSARTTPKNEAARYVRQPGISLVEAPGQRPQPSQNAANLQSAQSPSSGSDIQMATEGRTTLGSDAARPLARDSNTHREIKPAVPGGQSVLPAKADGPAITPTPTQTDPARAAMTSSQPAPITGAQINPLGNNPQKQETRAARAQISFAQRSAESGELASGKPVVERVPDQQPLQASRQPPARMRQENAQVIRAEPDVRQAKTDTPAPTTSTPELLPAPAQPRLGFLKTAQVVQAEGTSLNSGRVASEGPSGSVVTQSQSPVQSGAVPTASVTPGPGSIERAVSQQIAAAARTRAHGGVVEVVLDPPELGRIEITMEIADQGVRAVLTAERQTTGDLIRRNAEMLAQQFEEAGFSDVDLGFGENPEQAWHDADKAAADAGDRSKNAGSGPTLSKPMVVTADGRVDLRL